MAIPADYGFIRYLASKKSVDDRALNRHVWHSLEHNLSTYNFAPPVKVLEVGAGIGSMIERVFEWGLLKEATYKSCSVLRPPLTKLNAR